MTFLFIFVSLLLCQLSNYDFQYFDYIIPMNNHVYNELMNWVTFNRITETSKIIKLSAFSKHKTNTLNLSQVSAGRE